jgi:predicted TIM-barrel fold metal-dependent hydrolase
MEAFVNLVAAHPRTTFIGAHVCSAAETPARVGEWLAALPNLHLDISARLGELGRRPAQAAALLTRFSDRVLFGTDAFPPSAAVYDLHVRALESADAGFAYSPDPDDPAPQGRWTIDGLGLPEDVLTALYAENARKLITFA